MATLATDLITAQRARNTTLSSNPSLRPVQSTIHFARFSFTTAAGTAPILVAADVIDLGFLKLGKVKVIPELCRVINPTAAPDVAAVLTLQKVDTAGTAVALTAAATLTAAAAVAMARVSSTIALTEVADTDYLRLLVGTVTTSASAGVIDVEIAYTSEEASC